MLIGHNWGSEHDPDTRECSPSSASGGKYIMYTYSVSGIDSNNHVSVDVHTCSLSTDVFDRKNQRIWYWESFKRKR